MSPLEKGSVHVAGASLLCKVWLVVVSRASTVWVADQISRNSKSVILLHAAHAVDLLVNFDIQAQSNSSQQSCCVGLCACELSRLTGTMEARL